MGASGGSLLALVFAPEFSRHCKTLECPNDALIRMGSVESGTMFDTKVPIEFYGGSQDGTVVEAAVAPELLEVIVNKDWREIYELQSSEAPFVYAQIGYAAKESWT